MLSHSILLAWFHLYPYFISTYNSGYPRYIPYTLNQHTVTHTHTHTHTPPFLSLSPLASNPPFQKQSYPSSVKTSSHHILILYHKLPPSSPEQQNPKTDQKSSYPPKSPREKIDFSHPSLFREKRFPPGPFTYSSPLCFFPLMTSCLLKRDICGDVLESGEKGRKRNECGLSLGWMPFVLCRLK